MHNSPRLISLEDKMKGNLIRQEKDNFAFIEFHHLSIQFSDYIYTEKNVWLA